MLREAILTFDDGRRPLRSTRWRRSRTRSTPTQEAIKLYLAQLMQRELTAAGERQVLEAVLFTTNLEHIGDIIDKGLLRLAAKKQKQGLRFSEDGWRDISAFHALIAEQMRRALAVFVVARRRGGARPRRREGPAARRGDARRPSGTSAGCATGCRRRSRPARCISTCCAT